MTSAVASIPRARRPPPFDPRVARFLELALADGHHVERVELRQITIAGDARVERWRVTRETVAADLAEIVFARALDDADAHRGLVSYGVVAVEGEEIAGRQLFKIAGGAAGNGSIGESEPPTEQGTIAFLQRQCEAAHKMGFAAMSSALDHYRRIVDTKDLRTETLEKNQFKTFEALQSLTNDVHARDLEHTRVKNADARKDAIANKGIELMPVIVAKLFGGAAKGGAFMGGELLKQLIGTLTPEQMQALAGTFTPTQMATFVELYSTIAPAEPAAAAEPAPAASAPATEPIEGEEIPHAG